MPARIKRLVLNTKERMARPLYAQILVVALAFTLMVMLSYRFMGAIERGHLWRNVEDAISYTEANIKSDLLESESILGGVSETIRDMILQGDDRVRVREYISHIYDYVQSNADKRMLGVIGFYGFFDAFDGAFLTASDWTLPEGYDPAARPWYAAAIDAAGDIGITQPYIDIYTNEISITFARRIFDKDGSPLGIVCLDMRLDKIEQHAVNTQLAQGGYGFLLSNEAKIIAHPEPLMLSMQMRDVKSHIADYEDELIQKGNISEVTTADYRGISSIVFIQKLYNNWYMGIVIPQSAYYQSMRHLAWILVALGAALTAILSAILIRIIIEKQRSDERMQTMFDAMPLGANFWDKNIELIDCSQEVARLFDLPTKQEYIDRFSELSPVYQSRGTASKLLAHEAVKKAFNEGYYRFEWMHQKLNGEPIPCEITLVRVNHRGGNIVVGYTRDLREYKALHGKIHEQNKKLKELAHWYENILDTIPFPISVTDANMDWTFINKATENYLEINRNDFMGKPCDNWRADICHTERCGIDRLRRGIKRTYFKQKGASFQVDGDVLIGINGEIEGYVEVVQDISEMENKNAKLRELSHWYQTILDTLPFPISVTDANMVSTFVNKALEKDYGVDRNTFIGQQCCGIQSVLCKTEDCGVARLRRNLKRTYFPHKGLSFQLDTEFLRGLNGEIAGHIEIVQDITKLEQITKRQAQAEAANRAKSDFLARVSHEIRTPMNAILGITEIQLQNENLPEDTEDALGKIYNSGYLLLNIINDILDLSKIEAGKLELAPVKYDVPSLINDAVHLNIMRFDSKSVEFVLELEEDIPVTLFGDELRIKQILNNLLSNAYKYTDSGEVTFSVYTEQEEGQFILVFRVSDTGQGMNPDQVSKLFDEYTRFNVEANRTTEGTGLGMSITKNLIRMMNGEISVESEPGKGTVFTVRLPQQKVDDEVFGKGVIETLKQFRSGKMSQLKKAPQIVREYMPYGKILVVDDVETNLYVARGLMSPYGLTIDSASSGFEAIEKIKEGAVYDVIFMDHFMPKKDGIETTKDIRVLGYTSPIIALTANALAGQAEMFIANGFDGYISKPIDIRQLNDTLNKLVRNKYPEDVVEAARQLKERLNKNTAENPQHISAELAGIFVRDAEKAAAVLESIHKKQDAYGNEDIPAYIINIHAMKSALANIGETELSDLAAKLEQAGRDGNTAVLSGETPLFLNVLRAAIKRMEQKKEDDGDERVTQEDRDYLYEKLLALQEACAVYDKKAAKEALSALNKKPWPRPVKKQLNIIAEHLLHSEFEGAANAAGQMDSV